MNTELLLQLLILAVSKTEALAALYRQTRAENREPTDAELDAAAAGDDMSRKALQDWITAKKAGG